MRWDEVPKKPWEVGRKKPGRWELSLVNLRNFIDFFRTEKNVEGGTKKNLEARLPTAPLGVEIVGFLMMITLIGIEDAVNHSQCLATTMIVK